MNDVFEDKVAAKHLVRLLISVLTVWLLWWAISVFLVAKGDISSAFFGEVFGGIAALFSAFAFGALILTVHLQSKQLRVQMRELRLQRKELAETRKELARSAMAQEASQEALAKQVVAMNDAAFLNGLSTLLNYFSEATERARRQQITFEKSKRLSKKCS